MLLLAMTASIFARHKEHDGIMMLADGQCVMTSATWHADGLVAMFLAGIFHHVQHCTAHIDRRDAEFCLVRIRCTTFRRFLFQKRLYLRGNLVDDLVLCRADIDTEGHLLSNDIHATRDGMDKSDRRHGTWFFSARQIPDLADDFRRNIDSIFAHVHRRRPCMVRTAM